MVYGSIQDEGGAPLLGRCVDQSSTTRLLRFLMTLAPFRDLFIAT